MTQRWNWLFFNTGNQDERRSLPGPGCVDVDRNVHRLKHPVNVKQVSLYSVVNIFSRTPASPIPVGRSWHTLTAVSDTSLFLFGGLSVDCKPMSKKTLPPFYFLLFLDPFFSFWFDLKVMGGCLMLRQSYGEKWSILLIINQGRKDDLRLKIL